MGEGYESAPSLGFVCAVLCSDNKKRDQHGGDQCDSKHTSFHWAAPFQNVIANEGIIVQRRSMSRYSQKAMLPRRRLLLTSRVLQCAVLISFARPDPSPTVRPEPVEGLPSERSEPSFYPANPRSMAMAYCTRCSMPTARSS